MAYEEIAQRVLLRAFLGMLVDVAQQVPDDGLFLSQGFYLACAEIVGGDQVDGEANDAQAHKTLHSEPQRQTSAQRVRAQRGVHCCRSSIT